MSGRAVSITGFLVLLTIGVALEVWARRSGRPEGRRLPAAAPALAAAMRTTPGRVAVFAWWWWLGIHFLAR